MDMKTQKLDFSLCSIALLNIKMTKSEKKVYEQLKGCDYLTITQLAIKIGRSEKIVYKTIKGLKKKNYIKREENDINDYWKILM